MVRSLPADRVQRELRLFAAACVRRVWGILPEAGRIAIEASEQFAEGHAAESELQRALMVAEEAALAVYPGHSAADARAYAVSAAVDASSVWPRTAANVLAASTCAASAAACAAAENVGDSQYDQVYEAARRMELAAQAHLLRTLVGNPVG